MFRNTKRLADHEIRIAALALAVAELRKQHEKALPSELFKLIETMQSEIDSIRISLRSLHGKIAYEKRRETPAAGRVDDGIPDDDEFVRLLELQRSHGSSN